MSARAIWAVEQARKAADLLAEIGCHKQAEDVRRVCRSNASYRTTLATLHRDNMRLRQRPTEERRKGVVLLEHGDEPLPIRIIGGHIGDGQ